MHPNTLPSEFYQFMIKSARIPDFMLRQVAANARGKPVSVGGLRDFVIRHLPTPKRPALEYVQNELTNAHPAWIPCEIVHPSSVHCAPHSINLWLRVFRQIFVVYAPLNFIPLLLLHWKSLMQRYLLCMSWI